jgi:hypothetical protein
MVNRGKFYYEVDKFIEINGETLTEACKKNKIMPSVKNRITRIEWDAEINITYYKETETSDDLENDDYCYSITKEEYYNSSQIKTQLLIKALKELK